MTLCKDCIHYNDCIKDAARECKIFKANSDKNKHRKKKSKTLTFSQILHIAEVYDKIHHKYLHYGDIVNLVESNAEHCVCCGDTIPEGRQICLKCERMVKF